MSEQLLIRHCSPTLAGLKTGSLFTCAYQSPSEIREDIRRLNRRLRGKGLRVLPLRYSACRALIYVYRPDRLSKDLSDNLAQPILRERGYTAESPQECLRQLMRRLHDKTEFPHEIGLFLGYPPEDVHGFIDNKPGTCRMIGVWKVYGDCTQAQKIFAMYKKCTDLYIRQWANGSPLERLTVRSIPLDIRQISA